MREMYVVLRIAYLLKQYAIRSTLLLVLSGGEAGETIAYGAFGEYVAWVLRVVAKFLAQPAYVGLQIVHIAAIFVAPYFAQEHIKRQNAPGIAHKLVQELVFCWSEFHLLALD